MRQVNMFHLTNDSHFLHNIANNILYYVYHVPFCCFHSSTRKSKKIFFQIYKILQVTFKKHISLILLLFLLFFTIIKTFFFSTKCCMNKNLKFFSQATTPKNFFFFRIIHFIALFASKRIEFIRIISVIYVNDFN